MTPKPLRQRGGVLERDDGWRFEIKLNLPEGNKTYTGPHQQSKQDAHNDEAAVRQCVTEAEVRDCLISLKQKANIDAGNEVEAPPCSALCGERVSAHADQVATEGVTPDCKPSRPQRDASTEGPSKRLRPTRSRDSATPTPSSSTAVTLCLPGLNIHVVTSG